MTAKTSPVSTDAPAPKRKGRPPRAAADKQDKRVPVRMTDEDHAKLSALAAAAGVSGAAWFLQQLRKARVPVAGS